MGRHDFCLSRSHYTDTDPTSRETWLLSQPITFYWYRPNQWEDMTSVSADHIILIQTQPVGRHDFCLSRSHFTDTDPTSREWGDMTSVSADHIILIQTQPVGRHDFCLSRSHYTDTDPTSGETWLLSQPITLYWYRPNQWGDMTSVSADHIILIQTQPVGRGIKPMTSWPLYSLRERKRERERDKE